MSRTVLAVLVVASIALAVFFYSLLWGEEEPPPTETRTVTVERTIPGPERTVFKRKPGQTIWIIVCGEKTQRVVGDKPIQECKLPDTGGMRK